MWTHWCILILRRECPKMATMQSESMGRFVQKLRSEMFDLLRLSFHWGNCTRPSTSNSRRLRQLEAIYPEYRWTQEVIAWKIPPISGALQTGRFSGFSLRNTRHRDNELPIKLANSPSNGINMHGFLRPRLSLHPPAKRIIMMPKNESNGDVMAFNLVSNFWLSISAWHTSFSNAVTSNRIVRLRGFSSGKMLVPLK